MLDATTGTTHWTTPATGGGGFVGSFKNLEVKGKALFTNGIELEGTFTQKRQALYMLIMSLKVILMEFQITILLILFLL